MAKFVDCEAPLCELLGHLTIHDKEYVCVPVDKLAEFGGEYLNLFMNSNSFEDLEKVVEKMTKCEAEKAAIEAEKTALQTSELAQESDSSFIDDYEKLPSYEEAMESNSNRFPGDSFERFTVDNQEYVCVPMEKLDDFGAECLSLYMNSDGFECNTKGPKPDVQKADLEINQDFANPAFFGPLFFNGKNAQELQNIFLENSSNRYLTFRVQKEFCSIFFVYPIIGVIPPKSRVMLSIQPLFFENSKLEFIKELMVIRTIFVPGSSPEVMPEEFIPRAFWSNHLRNDIGNSSKQMLKCIYVPMMSAVNDSDQDQVEYF